MVEQCCDRVILLDHGTIVAEGQTEAILGDQRLLEEHGLC